jgi:hypothetical protein
LKRTSLDMTRRFHQSIHALSSSNLVLERFTREA